MRHRKAPRDPTIPLVLGLVVVAAVLFLTQTVGINVDFAASQRNDVPPDLTTTAPASPDPTGSTGKPQRVTTDVMPKKPVGRPSCFAATTDTDVVAVSYNIKSGRGGGSLGAIAETLRASEADIVLLQEVDTNRYNSGNINMPAYFAAQLGMDYYAFGANVSYGSGRDYGTAIVSRYPILSWENTHLPRPGNTQQRGLLHALIDIDGKKLSLYNTHLQNLSEPARMLQTAAINTIVADDPNPQILAGDFNAQPESRPLGVLKAHWFDTWGTVGTGDGRTHPANRLRGRIDYLMHANTGITPIAADVLPARLSDHMAVRALYRVEGDDEKVCFQKMS